jgi:RNA polymerase sigma factor (sigma-70 family)
MTDISLFYESDVTIRLLYGFGRQARPLWPTLAAPMTPEAMTVDAETSSLEDETDRRWTAWMVAAQAGDRATYENLLRDCMPFIKRVARGQGIRNEFVDDVVQETLLAIHRARQTYDPSRSFAAWLRTIAQRRAIDGLRRACRTGAHEVYAPLAYENHSDPSGDPEEAASQIDRSDLLKFAISKLSAKQREVVDYLAIKSQSLTQAATATGRSTGSLRVNWHRALKNLRTQLGGRD